MRTTTPTSLRRPQPPLQLALAERHALDLSQVLVTAGSTEVIDAVFRTFARAGSEVVIPDPSWPVFRRRLDALEARIVACRSRWTRTAIPTTPTASSPRSPAETRLVVVCSPNNPTGNPMRARRPPPVAETGVPLLLDAAYADFDPAGDPMSSSTTTTN